MKQAISKSFFVDQIVGDEYNDITYQGAKALFEYLEEIEEETGEEMDFDSVAIRCDFAEYENIGEVLKEYDSIKNIEELRDNTVVIEIPDSNRLIIQQF